MVALRVAMVARSVATVARGVAMVAWDGFKKTVMPTSSVNLILPDLS